MAAEARAAPAAVEDWAAEVAFRAGAAALAATAAVTVAMACEQIRN